MNQPESDKDSRMFPRIPKDIPVEVSEISYPFSEKPGKRCSSKNISGGGICFVSSNPYKSRALLNLNIRIAGWQSYKKPFSLFVDLAAETPLTVIGEVVWCKANSNDLTFDIGIKFLNIDQDDHRAFMSYLDSSGNSSLP